MSGIESIGEYLEKAQPSESADISPQKARQILHDGTVRGHPLTDQQRKFFGAIASRGRKAKKAAGFYTCPRGKKWADPQFTIPWKEKSMEGIESIGEYLEKSILGYGKRIDEWASQFMGTPLYAKALQLTKRRLEVASEFKAFNEKGLSYRELEEMPLSRRKEIQAKRDKERSIIERKGALVDSQGRALEESLLDYRIAEEKRMGKSMEGIESIGEYLLKGAEGDLSGDNAAGKGGMPHGSSKFGTRGPEDGEDLAGKGKIGGTGGGNKGTAPSRKPGEKLSEDDEQPEDQMKNHPKWDEQRRGSQVMMGRYRKSEHPGGPLTPSRQRDMVAHEHAVLIRKLQKGDDVVAGVGVDRAPDEEPKPLEKATYWRHGDLTHYTNASDLACERLLKSDSFYHGGAPRIDNTGLLRKSEVCPNGHVFPAYLSSCTTCGLDTSLGVSASTSSPVRLQKSGRGLVAHREADLVLPNGAVFTDTEE